MRLSVFLLLAAVSVFAGCVNYSWKSEVPEDRRTVFVGVFRNKSEVTTLGSALARQVAREFQREGTFGLSTLDAAALEVQGVVLGASSKMVAFDRESSVNRREHRFEAEAMVSFIDKKSGRVLVDNRKYKAVTSFLNGSDLASSQKDASERLAEDFARQIVDDALMLKWN